VKGYQSDLRWTLGVLLLWAIILPTRAKQALPAPPPLRDCSPRALGS
jgi:hypothetical protein